MNYLRYTVKMQALKNSTGVSILETPGWPRVTWGVVGRPGGGGDPGRHADLSLLCRESLKVAPSAGGNETPLRQAAGAGSLLGLTTSTKGEESDYLREKLHIKLQFLGRGTEN